MNAQAKFDLPKVPAGKPFTVRLMLAIGGPEQSVSKRSPLNISLVLDHSGSMSGGKLANVKEATRLLVNQLAKDDVFSLTIFDDKVKRLIKPVKICEARDLESVISGIRSGGSTYLSGGYEAGCAMAAENKGYGCVTRVMLLTDGLANVGIQYPEQFAAYAEKMQKEGIATTTIGVGDDYDEFLLGRIAEHGGGGSYFIETPNDAPAVFTEEFGCLLALSATDCKVRFLPDFEGIRFDQLNTYKIGDDGAYLLGDVYGGKNKTLVLELELPPFDAAGEITVGRFDIAYRDATKADAGTKSMSVPVALYAIPMSQFVGITPDNEVILAACFLMVARAKTESISLADKGRYAEAADLLDKYVKALKALGMTDGALMNELRQLERRSRELRERGKDFFTVNERKRMYYESGMMSKCRMANYYAMMNRREDPETERAQRFTCYNHSGHIWAEIGNEKCLIDTGTLTSFGEISELLLCGQRFCLQPDYLGHDVSELGKLVGTRISALIGVDILNKFDTVIDIAEGTVAFVGKSIPFHGVPIPTRYFQGIPIVRCMVGNQEFDLFLDSGAKLSFLDPSISSTYERIGEDTDFFPGFGEFRTDTYRVPLVIGAESLELGVGVLPGILQMTLLLAKANGIIGSALFNEFAVCLSAREGGVTIKKHLDGL